MGKMFPDSFIELFCTCFLMLKQYHCSWILLGACYNLFLGVPRMIKDIPRGGSISIGMSRKLQEPVKD